VTIQGHVGKQITGLVGNGNKQKNVHIYNKIKTKKMNKLRQLIRESINDYVREIDEAGNVAALEAKMGKTQEAIELREKKMNMEGIDEAYHDMLDKGKLKELGAEVKVLEKSLAKYKKMLEKLKSKSDKSPKVEDTEEKEIVDEVAVDVNLGENEEDSPYKVKSKDRKYLSMPGMENFDEDEDLRYDEEGNEDVNGMYDVGGNFIGDEGQSIDKAMMDKGMDEEMDIYERLHMQKMAGIISESE
jgi:hypothetical protein